MERAKQDHAAGAAQAGRNRPGEVKRFGDHDNAFGFLRLVFASLVIVSHTQQLVDGDAHRELFVRTFGTFGFGGLAVDCFFLVSGYLITGSYLQNPNGWAYLRKRTLRIYPAFFVASLISILIVAPLAGATRADIYAGLPAAALRMPALQTPLVSNVFSGTPYPVLNGSMWTIAYEFRCYLLLLILGAYGVLARPRVVALLASLFYLGFATGLGPHIQTLGNRLPLSILWMDKANDLLRMSGVFLVGSLFYLWRDRIVFTGARAMVAFALMIACFLDATLAEPGLILFGGYLVFAAAKHGRGTVFARINNRNDISYGLYLYAWPVEKLLLWFWPHTSLVAVGTCTWILAALLGWASWHLLEKPVLAYSGRLARRVPSSAPIPA